MWWSSLTAAFSGSRRPRQVFQWRFSGLPSRKVPPTNSRSRQATNHTQNSATGYFRLSCQRRKIVQRRRTTSVLIRAKLVNKIARKLNSCSWKSSRMKKSLWSKDSSVLAPKLFRNLSCSRRTQTWGMTSANTWSRKAPLKTQMIKMTLQANGKRMSSGEYTATSKIKRMLTCSTYPSSQMSLR